jgi:hypothetical protein
MRGAIPPLLKYVFMTWRLVKYKDNFTFTLCNRPAFHCSWSSGLRSSDSIRIRHFLSVLTPFLILIETSSMLNLRYVSLRSI